MVQKYFAAIGFCFIAVGLSPSAVADLGPKPRIQFSFLFDHKGRTVTGGTLLQCKKTDCSDAWPLKPLGPQNFGCSDTGCGGLAYGFAKFGMLELIFSDGQKIRSNIFVSEPSDVSDEKSARRRPMPAPFSRKPVDGKFQVSLEGGKLIVTSVK